MAKNLLHGFQVMRTCGLAFRELNRRLLEEMMRTTAAAGADFLLVYLPYGRKLWDPDHVGPGEAFFRSFVEEHAVGGLDPRPNFLEHARGDDPWGPYQAAEARLVSQLVYDTIRTLPSWRR